MEEPNDAAFCSLRFTRTQRQSLPKHNIEDSPQGNRQFIVCVSNLTVAQDRVIFGAVTVDTDRYESILLQMHLLFVMED